MRGLYIPFTFPIKWGAKEPPSVSQASHESYRKIIVIVACQGMKLDNSGTTSINNCCITFIETILNGNQTWQRNFPILSHIIFSGKPGHNYGKIHHFFMGKLTQFNGYVANYQKVIHTM